MDREYDENIRDITLLSMKQVLKVLGVSQTVYYRLVNSGQLPVVSLGSRRLVRFKALKEYLDSVEPKKRRAYGGGFGF
jgi:excisionase family DNA binding protein